MTDPSRRIPIAAVGAEPSESGVGADRETATTCPYCGVGCGVIVESRGDRIVGVRGDPDHPANFGRLCTKGSTLHLTATVDVIRDARVLHPELRTSRDAPRVRVGWDEALDHVADRFDAIVAEHGPDAVAFYISGQLLTEDYYVFNKLAKGLVGTNNVDTNSRLCMSSAVAGYKQTLGADAPPTCYEDFDHADLLLVAGSNTAYSHPILYRRIEDARRAAAAAGRPLRTIVVDPRRTDTAREADLHLAITPGTDVALFHGLLHLCLWDDRIDDRFIESHTDGWPALKRLVRDYTPKSVAAICGIDEQDLVTAAGWFGEAKAALSLYCQGLNQSSSGTAKNATLINLHLATGQIGRPGAGPFSLTGQPNAMGGREVGGMANLLSAHRDLDDPVHRAEVAALWGVDDVPSVRGRTAVEMFDAIADGSIKAVWIACTNPAQSMPSLATVHAALRRAELVVLQESFVGTATAPFADVLLPAATWGEKSGTVTNSERRISRVRQAVPAPGDARDDWAIACDFARRLERRRAARTGASRPSMFAYADAEAIWNEHRESTRGRDLDITGLSWATLDARGPQLWPFASGATEGTKRLYTDGVFATPNGRARFVATPHRPVAEAVDARYPFALNTGRLRDQWHGMSRTGRVPQLFGHAAEPAIELSDVDAKRRLLADGDFVQVSSRRGSQAMRVRVGDTMRAGQAYIAMHWGEEHVGGAGERHGVNGLTSPVVDPDSLQPELKHAAVRIVKLDLPWRVVAFGWVAPDAVAGTMARMRATFGGFAYASCVPFGRTESPAGPAGAGRVGVLFRAAHDDALHADAVAAVEASLGIGAAASVDDADSHLLRYDDARRGHARRVLVRGDALVAVSLRGDWSAEAWLKEYLETAMPVATLGRLLLRPGVTAPTGFRTRGKVVCNCWNVGEAEIGDALATMSGTDGDRLSALQSRLKCGTQCGSCLPEVKRIVAARGMVSA